MVARYEVHPMEQKFRDDMAAKVVEDKLIEECWQEVLAEGHTDPRMWFVRGWHTGKYHSKQPQEKAA